MPAKNKAPKAMGNNPKFGSPAWFAKYGKNKKKSPAANKAPSAKGKNATMVGGSYGG